MKILILGKNGQVGAALVDFVEKESLSYLALGHEEINIINMQAVAQQIELFMPTCVINATAFHVVPECEKDPETAFLVNAIAVKYIAQYCYEKNIQFATYSTDYVFDGKKGRPYVEVDAPHPLQIYGISKLAGEFAALSYNPNAIIIRTSGVYGGREGSKAKRGNFIINLLRDAKEKKEIEVSSEQIVSTTYAVDLAKATVKLLKKKPLGGMYHLVNEGYCSWADFAKRIVSYAGLSTKIIPVDRGGYSSNAHRPVFSVLKNKKARALKIYLPQWEASLKKYVTYLQG